MTVWVFAYGSLLWDPGFVPAESPIARLEGYHRSFCMESIHYRGTPQAPGLVLALDAATAAVCHGVAFRIAAGDETSVLAALRKRELISDAYVEEVVEVVLADGRQVRALTYVISPGHVQYCRLPHIEQARRIASAAGVRGPNCDYLFNTVAHLRGLGLADPELEQLAADVRRLNGID